MNTETTRERVYLYIDGGNLYYNLKENGCGSMEFNFKKFVEELVGERKLEGVRYYIGQIRPIDGDEKSQILHRHQQILFEKLKTAGFYIIRGHIRQIGKIFTEKGVDVRIGIDLVEGAYEDRYDRAILISSDGDLAPAVEMVIRKGKKVEIVGFEHKPSYSLIQKTNTYHSIKKSDLEKFVPQKKSNIIPKKTSPNLAKLLAKVNKKNIHKETDTGNAVGKEL
ncbi:MAG: NYN domain-containing protein [Candidatus Gracilibacteria bacterium]